MRTRRISGYFLGERKLNKWVASVSAQASDMSGWLLLVWKRLDGGLFDVYEIVPGFLFSSAAIIMASMAGRQPGDEILDEFGSVADGRV